MASLAGLSIDVEEYFQVEAFADIVKPDDWTTYPSRVESNTRKTLDLCARHGARATFFIVGWVAERHPELVREIVAAGHEIGCHSYAHRALWRLSPEEFRKDTRRALDVLQQVSGVKVRGYRAPTFSVVARTLWAVEILAEEGLVYDSSVFPIRHDRYGMPNAPRYLFRWETPAGELYELPMTTAQLGGRNWPAAGGGYLRLLPLAYTKWAIERVKTREGRVPILYFHPWEIDPEQPRLKCGWRTHLRHYSNLGRMEARLDSILREWQFLSLAELLRHETERETPVSIRACAGELVGNVAGK